jgi:hypothetical protein
MRIAITVEVMNKINACAALLRCSWLTAIVSNLNPTTMKISPVRPAEAPPDIAANVVHKPVHLFLGYLSRRRAGLSVTKAMRLPTVLSPDVREFCRVVG